MGVVTGRSPSVWAEPAGVSRRALPILRRRDDAAEDEAQSSK